MGTSKNPIRPAPIVAASPLTDRHEEAQRHQDGPICRLASQAGYRQAGRPKLGDLITESEACIDFAALAAEVDRIAPRPVSLQGGRPPFPTEAMVRILVLKRLYNLPASGPDALNVDKQHKCIGKIATDTASTDDGRHFEAVLDPADTRRDVYADRGYPSEERAAWLKANGYRNRIQGKGHRNKPLSEVQQGRNRRIAKTRARVAHVFAGMAQMGGRLIRPIGQARAHFAMALLAACYNLKRLSCFQKAGSVPA